jgi:hypothetical protein
MSNRRKSPNLGEQCTRPERTGSRSPGHVAQSTDKTLQSYDVGALPIINQILDRMQLSKILSKHLAPDDPRTRVSTAQGNLVLVRNILLLRDW